MYSWFRSIYCLVGPDYSQLGARVLLDDRRRSYTRATTTAREPPHDTRRRGLIVSSDSPLFDQCVDFLFAISESLEDSCRVGTQFRGARGWVGLEC